MTRPRRGTQGIQECRFRTATGPNGLRHARRGTQYHPTHTRIEQITIRTSRSGVAVRRSSTLVLHASYIVNMIVVVWMTKNVTPKQANNTRVSFGVAHDSSKTSFLVRALSVDRQSTNVRLVTGTTQDAE
jgi:hypothetical protein